MSKKTPQGLRFQTGSRKQTQQKVIPVGKKQRLTIDRFAHDGRGIAQVDGKAWFVAGALPTEEVEARVLTAQSKWVDARCERIFKAAAIRQTPPCRYADKCGGCELQHISYEQQLAIKQQNVIDQFQRLAGVTIEQWQPILFSEPFEYRRRARIAVRYNEQTEQLDIGFRAAFSQQIIAVDDCLVLSPSLHELFKQLPACLNQLSAQRSIGHIELLGEDPSALLVRHTAPLNDADKTILQRFCKDHQCQLWLQGKGEPELYQGSSILNYSLQTNQRILNLEYRPGDFIQINGKLNQLMVLQALDWLQIQADERVLDLFSGLGNFSLPLATQAKEVVAIEAVDGMVKLAEKNAQLNDFKNVFFYQTNLSEPLAGRVWAKGGFPVVLLDPPRDGAAEIVKQMKKLDTKRVLYVSCNPSTLARDASLLIEQGYRIKKAGIMDMFPQTSHVEVMVLFER